MNPWEAIAAIAIVVSVLRFLSHRRHPHGVQAPPPLPFSREAELEREVAELRDRIAVLERIATEDRHGRAIAAEIEALRKQ